MFVVGPTAVVFSGGKGETATPVRDLDVGGMGLTRRITHALRGTGCSQAFVAADALHYMAPAALSRDAKNFDVTIVPTGSPIDLPEQGAVFLVPADVLIDQRAFEAMQVDVALHVVATSPRDPSIIVAKVSAQWLRAQAPVLLDHATFERLISGVRDSAKIIDVQTLDTYLASQRRAVPMLWQRVRTRAEAKLAFTAILDAAQKGVQDWPAWFIHRPVEHWITARLCATAITPTQITAIGGILGLAAAWLFARGLFFPGLMLGLAIGILDGIGDKLARVKLISSPIGEIEHVVDKGVEYLIYFSMAYHFSEAGYGALPYVMAGALILFHFADEVQLEFFRRMSGKFLCDASPFDRRFRMIAGRRNTQIWTFLPFVLSGAWFAGFCMICIYGIATFFVHQWRFVVNSRRVLEDTSPVFRATFDRTSVLKKRAKEKKETPTWETPPDPESRPAE